MTETAPSSSRDIVAVRVFRLQRPKLDCRQYSYAVDESDSCSKALATINERRRGLGLGIDDVYGEQLCLAELSYEMYIGETLSAYICAQNVSETTLTDVAMKTSVQSTSGTQALNSKFSNGGITLKPGETLETVVSHEVKTLGQIYLAVTVTFTMPTRSAQGETTAKTEQRRKVLKCSVDKPLDVRTKMHNADGKHVFVEAYIENLMTMPMVLEKMALEPTDMYRLCDSLDAPTVSVTLPIEQKLDGVDASMEKLSLELAKDTTLRSHYLAPRDIRSYIYRLETTSNDEALYRGGTDIGKIWIEWRSSMGEKGRLQTSSLKTVSPGTGDIRLRITKAPSQCPPLKLVELECSVTNCSERQLDLKVVLEDGHSPALLWCNTVSGARLGHLSPGETLTHTLNVLPICCGLHAVAGLRIQDTLTSRTYEFDECAHLLVV